MADPQPPASGASADLESKEIWGDEADQLDEEIMKVQRCSRATDSRLQQQCFAFRLQPGSAAVVCTEGSVGSVRELLFGLISIP